MSSHEPSSGPITPHPPEDQAVPSTWAGVVGLILSTPKRWLPLLGILTLAVVLAIVIIFEVPRLFSAETTEVSIGGNNSHIVIKSVGRHGEGTYLVVVSPQGWQPSSISVHKGDHLEFTAGGKVCIDVNSIMVMVAKRLKYEDEWAKKLGIRRNDATETRVPEDYFSESEQKDLILDRPWVDPDGFSLDRFHPSFRSRRQRYLLPDSPAGGLVAAIADSDTEEPKRTNAFFVGRERKDYVVPVDGSLWLNINDVQYSDSLNRNLFYNDNIGYFWVRIEVTHH